MSKPYERLKQARTEAGYRTAADFARDNDLKLAAYRHHENGTREFSSKKADTYANKLNVDVRWLLFGEQPVDNKQLLGLTEVSVSFAQVLSEYEILTLHDADFAHLDSYKPKKDEKIAVPFNESSVVAYVVNDISMSRTIPEGSRVVIDIADVILTDSKIYALRVDDRIIIRRFSGGGFEADSYQQPYPSIEHDEDVSIIGRVGYIVQPL